VSGVDAAALPADLRAWLHDRQPAPPAALRDRMLHAILAVVTTRTGDAAIPTTLAEASLDALRHALVKCDERAAAIDLLAADALLTYAMEAAAEQGGAALIAIAEAYGNNRLVQLTTESL
jgi:hypothetical protein